MPNFGVEFHLRVRAASSAYFRGSVRVVVVDLNVDAELSFAVGRVRLVGQFFQDSGLLLL